MLPSLLARDIQQGIQHFLITGFEPADGFFHGVRRRFVADEPPDTLVTALLERFRLEPLPRAETVRPVSGPSPAPLAATS